MAEIILADWKRYNANSRDVNTGDCVKRALSVAYSMDYDAVSQELNQIKRAIGQSAYNITPVFSEFMRRRGDKFQKFQDDQNVDSFCENNSSGVYLLLVGKTKQSSTHMAAVVDGTLYDSWDSCSWMITNVCKLSSGKSETYEMHYNDIKPRLDEYLIDYVAKLNDKCPDCMRLEVCEDQDFLTHVDRYTYDKYLRCNLGNVPELCMYRSNVRLGYQLTIKLNPRLSLDENLNNLLKKIKQKVYDWVYNIRKDIQDAEKAESIEAHPRFRGDKKILARLPEWCRSKVRYFYDNGEPNEYSSWDRYELELEADPEDPRYEDAEIVYLRGDTWTDLKYQLKCYKEDFSRPDYDY